jgi:hypothetical protein
MPHRNKRDDEGLGTRFRQTKNLPGLPTNRLTAGLAYCLPIKV